MFLSLTVNLVNGQDIVAQDTLQINYVGQKQGLLQLNVKAIVQDQLDYLWLATEDGLHRFNGAEFKVYLNNPLDELSIPEDHARDLFVANDTLFIASNSKGVFGFKMSTNTFFEVLRPEGNKGLETSYRILTLNNTQLLFSSRNNFLIFDRKTKGVTMVELPETGVENYVKAIVPLDEHLFLLATTASGLLKFNSLDLSLKKLKGADDSEHRALLKFDDTIYVGTNEGLYAYDVNLETGTKLSSIETINCFYAKDKFSFWIGSEHGLLEYNTSTKSLTKLVLSDADKNSYDPIDINDINGDDKGNVWFGTEGEGLLHFNSYQKKFETLKLRISGYSASKKISAFQFLPVKDSTVFIGSSYGLLKYNFNKQDFKHYKNHQKALIYTLAKDKNGRIWAGGFTTGLLKYNPSTDSFVEVSPFGKDISDRDVIQITPLSASELLVATWAGGMYKYNVTTNRYSNYLINGQPLNRARISYIDSQNNIWLGTDEGAFRIAPNGKITHLTIENEADKKISGNRVFAIAEDSKGNIWLGTNVGLTKLNPNTLITKLYYKQKGLPNDFIYAVLIDQRDFVWVSSNLGISVLNPEKNSFENYTINDGLQNNEFNGKAAFKDRFGNFYFGGVDGVNIFNPKDLKVNPFEPKVHIESVELFNSPLNQNELYTNALSFKSNENVLTFNFSALNHLNPEKINYSYFMEGFDNTWRPISKSKTTTYTNLNPGDYTFRVKATNDNGVWSSKEDSIKLKIVPPWYKTTYFRVFAVILIILSGVLFYITKTMRLKREKLKLEVLVDKRTKEVLAKNEALQIAFKNSETQKENIKFLMRELRHRVKNNLQIISSLLNIQSNTLKNEKAVAALRVAKNRILTISHLEDQMETEYETIEISNFTEVLSNSILSALSDEGELKFKVDYNIPKAKIKGLNTTIYGLILNELITNVTKYAFDEYKDTNALKISCIKKNETLILTVGDNGKGYTNKDVSRDSMGLDLVKEMVVQLNGSIQIDSVSGTKNTIGIPLV